MSIEAPRRIITAPYGQTPSTADMPSGTIEGLFYKEDGGVIKIDYADFVEDIKGRITGEAVNAFRWRLVQNGTVDASEVKSRLPDSYEIDSAIYQGFDRLAVNSLTSLFSSLKHSDLPQNVVFTAPERPFTPWEGRVQEWLAGQREPLEATGGMYGMYGPEEYPQLHFQSSDGSEL